MANIFPAFPPNLVENPKSIEHNTLLRVVGLCLPRGRKVTGALPIQMASCSYYCREFSDVLNTIIFAFRAKGVMTHAIIPAFGKLRQENGEFEVSLGYIVSSRSV